MDRRNVCMNNNGCCDLLVREPTEEKGQKNDEGKQQWYRMPLCVLDELAKVYCIAGAKYPPFNCLLPFEEGNRRLYDAMMRHVVASQINPLARNEEDGNVYHLAQVAFCALTRLYNEIHHGGCSEKT